MSLEEDLDELAATAPKPKSSPAPDATPDVVPDLVRVHALVAGKVQGVWFREATKQEAQRRMVSGWVRNLVDGRVEAVFEGPASVVDRMVEWCKGGPPSARVDEVVWDRETPRGESGFQVRH